MLKIAVVGKDVSRSQSPVMHTFILNRLGAECRYDAISLPPEEFDVRIEEIFARYDAVNVTIPFKGDVIPHLRELKGDALAFGAVNVVLTGTRTGYNTDGYGFLLMLENEGVALAGKRVLVLGTGGVGRSCIRKLTEAGASVFAYERNEERLKEVYEEIGSFTPLGQIEACGYDIVFNCTGIGMHDTVGRTPSVRTPRGETPVGEELLSRCETAVDLIYEPAQSEFLRIAAGLNKRTVNGASMLFYQAYMADCIYLNKTPSAAQAKALWAQYLEETV